MRVFCSELLARYDGELYDTRAIQESWVMMCLAYLLTCTLSGRVISK